MGRGNGKDNNAPELVTETASSELDQEMPFRFMGKEAVAITDVYAKLAFAVFTQGSFPPLVILVLIHWYLYQ